MAAKTILVVDDEPDVVSLLETTLKAEGFNVLTAYDGIAAIGALVKSGRPDALGRAALTQPSGFVGVNGIFRLRPDGSNERGLAVAEIRNGQAVVIDAAPRSFGMAGY